MNFLLDIDNQTQLIAFAFFLALFLFSLGVSQFFRQRSERRELIAKIRGGGIATDPAFDDEVDEAENKDSPHYRHLRQNRHDVHRSPKWKIIPLPGSSFCGRESGTQTPWPCIGG